MEKVREKAASQTELLFYFLVQKRLKVVLFHTAFFGNDKSNP